jgi:CRISPR-associated endoribonuclease Cas6
MKQYTFKISYGGKFSYSWGYAMYSAFLEQLNKEEAGKIHEDASFSQYITPDQWVISSEKEYSLNDSYFLHKYNMEIKLLDKEIEEITEQQMADKYLVNAPFKKNMRIYFLTPTTFKQAGEYVLYPTQSLIMQSLTTKWNQWAQHFVLEDMTWDNCKISKYNLRSVAYSMKGVKIQGFVGYVDLFFWGAESIIRLANMICNFGKFSGAGIKTTLGMGGIKVE